MADTINPIQPSTPSLQVKNSPDEDKRKDDKRQAKSSKDTNTKQESSGETPEKPHHGLFDEYV